MIIKGTHSRPGTVQAETEDLGGLPADIDQPNHSFKYLSIDVSQPPSSAFLTADQPDQVRNALKALGDAMIEESDSDVGNSTIPPVYTYWGQFIDHDITAGTDRDATTGFNMLASDILDADFTPQAPAKVEAAIVNLRLPQLDLDSVYGGELGPQEFGVPAEGIYQEDNLHLNVGTNHIDDPQRTPNPHLDNGSTPMRDLPRHTEEGRQQQPRVGDERNDENTIVAQFHTAFLRFHNNVVDFLLANPATANHSLFQEQSTFAVARQIVRWTYQWLVVNDYLHTVAKGDVVDEILASATGFFQHNAAFMPLEYSVAAFRFGHSMVRARYDFNMNFGRGNGDLQPLIERSPFELLFAFTGSGRFNNSPEKPNLPNTWIIDWERFVDKNSSFLDRFARRIDTNLAIPLQNLPLGDTMLTRPQQDIAKHLARRNLLRGYLLSIPIGEHVAQSLGVQPLSTKELVPDDKRSIAGLLQSRFFRGRTPLWYYILREAEVQTKGNSLGELGSRLVAGTLIGLLKADPNSYLNKGWDPSHETAMKLLDGSEIRGIMDFFRFAGVA